jgi:crotonobetainyl-CoA:carnitine CoA-transferase CaiB-like acyl-CoA transferase
LKRVNPGLVMLSISGFGQTGPQAGRPGFGKIAEGLSGIVNLTGEAGAAPLFVGFSLADASAGLFGVHGVAVALFLRDVLGHGGARIDLALFEPLMRMLDCQFALHAAEGRPPARGGTNDPYGFGTASPGRPRFQSFQSRAGSWYFLAIPAGMPETGLTERCGRLTDAELEAELAALGIEFTPVMDGLTIADAPYFQARGDVVWTEMPELGRIAAAGPVCDDPDGRPILHAPAIGAHNAAVFGEWLGLDAAELDRLRAEGAI